MDSPERESNSTNINNSIRQLTMEIVNLEDLLSEIQGVPTQQAEKPEISKDAVPSVSETMSQTAGRIYKLIERVAMAKNGIREAIF